jgi:hypothetical protein
VPIEINPGGGGGGGGGVSSVFGRTGAVVAVNGDYEGVVAAALTGATAATRYVGGTTSGAPVSGTFAVGDFVVVQNGHIFVCTVAGSPGTWVDVGSVSNLVTSVFGRTGAVAATSGDYNLNQIGNATADYSINSHKLTNLTDPSAAQDAATKHYVDSVTPGNAGGKGHLTTATAPNTPADLAPGADGTVLTADSTQSTGLSWSAGGMALINEYVASSDMSSLDSGATIPSGFRHLLVVFRLRLASSNAVDTVVCRVNADTSGSYDELGIQYNGAAITTRTTGAATFWELTAPTTAGDANRWSSSLLWLFHYADSPAGISLWRTGRLDDNAAGTAAAANMRMKHVNVEWHNTAAINQISVSGGTNVKQGSTMTIYGLQ